MDREELAWAAGFFDGEGCFSYTEAGHYSCVRIAQSERQPLDRFREAVGFGKVYGPYLHASDTRWTRKPQYSFQLTGHEKIQALLAMLWFKLGPTKREQAVKVLYRATHCKKGHPKAKGRAGCGKCMTNYWQNRRDEEQRTLNLDGKSTESHRETYAKRLG